MKKAWIIIPAAVLAVGAGAAGVSEVYSSGKGETYSVPIAYPAPDAEKSEDPRTDTQDAPVISHVAVSDKRGIAYSGGERIGDGAEYGGDTYDGYCPADTVCLDDNCGNYIDLDNNGICDNYEAAHCPANTVCPDDNCGNYIDLDNNGICDNYEAAHCPANTVCPDDNCGNYIDLDNNGICDNYEAAHCPADTVCPDDNCGNYIDSNNDGVCDNYANAHCHGNYGGRGGHHGKGHHGRRV